MVPGLGSARRKEKGREIVNSSMEAGIPGAGNRKNFSFYCCPVPEK